MKKTLKKAVFLDRDGTVSKELGYLRPELMHKYGLLNFAAAGMKKLQKAGYALVVVTNQSGVARGLTREKDVREANRILGRLLSKQGVKLDGIYYCPHYHDKSKCSVMKYAVDCDCRKPKPGMALKAAKDLGLDLHASWMVGDKESDLKMADNFGGKSILALSGYGKLTLKDMKSKGRRPGFVAKNLIEAADIILHQDQHSFQGPSMKPTSKFVERSKLAKIIAGLKKKGKTVVFANGCYDLLHVGHIRYLQDARSHGDALVVALNSDASVRKLKGSLRPLIPLKERAELMSALSCVDYVTSFPELRAEKTLRILRPSIQAKGTDYTPDNVPEAALMRSLGGRVVIAGDPKDHSTTDLISKIKRAFH